MPYNPSVQDRSGEILAQGISQGFASLADGFTTAIGEYNKKKEEKQVIDLATKAITDRASKSPELAKYLGLGDLSDTKALSVGLKAVGGGNAKQGAMVSLKALQEFDAVEAQRNQQREEQKVFGIATNALGQGMDPYSAVSQAGLTLSPGAAKAIAQMNEQMASAQRQRAEAARMPVVKEKDLSFQEQAFAAERQAQEAAKGSPLTAQEQSAIYRDIAQRSNPAGDPEATATMTMLTKELPATGDRGDVALRFIPTINSLSNKLDKGLKTGKFEELKTTVVGYAKSLGIPVDEAALGSSEAAQAQLGSFLLQVIAQTKGSTSERENTLFAAMGPQFSKSPAANKELLGLLKAQTDLDVEIGRIYRNGLGKEKLTVIAAKQQEARDRFAKKYDNMLSKAEESFGVTYDQRINAAIGN